MPGHVQLSQALPRPAAIRANSLPRAPEATVGRPSYVRINKVNASGKCGAQATPHSLKFLASRHGYLAHAFHDHYTPSDYTWHL